LWLGSREEQVLAVSSIGLRTRTLTADGNNARVIDG
jgi:hypothetical protein